MILRRGYGECSPGSKYEQLGEAQQQLQRQQHAQPLAATPHAVGCRLLACLSALAALLAAAAAASWLVCSRAAALFSGQASSASQAEGLIDDYLGGGRYYYERNLPEHRSQALLDECKSMVSNRTFIRELEFGTTSAAEGAKLAYRCTNVRGLFEKVPEVLRGVFWMRGNAISEELAVLQNGQWFEDELTYVAPFAPYMWAWAAGVPKDAPFGGRFYDEEARLRAAYSMPALRVAYSLRFRHCPGSARLPFPLGLSGHICDAAASAADLRYATLQSHTLGDLRAVSQEEVYSIEAMPDEVKRGTKWYRGIYGGPPWLGHCKCISIGSYELTKIIDGDGAPVEPYYSEFIEYMGSVPLMFWMGSSESPLGPI